MNVLITGACGGLGRAFAAECARRGHNLFLTDVNESGLKDLALGLKRQFHVFVFYESCDLTAPGSVDALLNAVDANGFYLDMLLNVAGIDFEGAFLEREATKLSAIIDLNIRATLNLAHSVLARRKNQNDFYIIFVSSLAALYPMPLKATYAASKRFLYDFSLALAREMKDQRVFSLALCPAGLPTTNEATEAIAAQGFWGIATTNKLEKVVRKTISRALRKQTVYIPGALNRTLSFLGALLPRKFAVSIVYKRWLAAQTKRAAA